MKRPDQIDEITQQRGTGKDSKVRVRFLTQLAHALAEVPGYKKIDPPNYTPTSSDLAKLKTATIPPEVAFIDLANQLTALEELTFYGSRERERGLTKTLAAGLPAPALRKLTLDGAPVSALDGALENPSWSKLEYLALYETNVSKAQLAAAFAHWTSLETFAIRTEAKLGVAMVDVIATAAPRLVELALVNTQLADAPIRSLFLERPWPKIARLFLSGNTLSAATIKDLEKHLSKVKVLT